MKELLDIKGDVGETKGKLDNFIRGHEERVTSVELKVRAIEQRQHWYAGASSIVGMVAGWFGSGHIKI